MISGYLYSSSIKLIVCRPVAPPVTVLGWLSGSATNGIWLLALKVTDRFVNCTPVLPYWFESHTYGVRPLKRPMPPRTWRCLPETPCPRSQLKPTRGDHDMGEGVISVRLLKSVTVT